MATPVTVLETPGPDEVNIAIQRMGNHPRAFAVPPLRSIGSSKSITWRNGTGAKARFWFPNGDQVFDLPSIAPGVIVTTLADPIDIPAGGSLILPVKTKTRPTDGTYHYHVYCEAVKDCAQGNSEPVITHP